MTQTDRRFRRDHESLIDDERIDWLSVIQGDAHHPAVALLDLAWLLEYPRAEQFVQRWLRVATSVGGKRSEQLLEALAYDREAQVNPHGSINPRKRPEKRDRGERRGLP